MPQRERPVVQFGGRKSLWTLHVSGHLILVYAEKLIKLSAVFLQWLVA